MSGCTFKGYTACGDLNTEAPICTCYDCLMNDRVPPVGEAEPVEEIDNKIVEDFSFAHSYPRSHWRRRHSRIHPVPISHEVVLIEPDRNIFGTVVDTVTDTVVMPRHGGMGLVFKYSMIVLMITLVTVLIMKMK